MVRTTSVKPNRTVQCNDVTDNEPLKHVVSVLVCDDRQRWIPSHTKLSRFIPSQHWTTRVTRVQTICLTVHCVTLGHFDCVDERDSYITCIHRCYRLDTIITPTFSPCGAEFLVWRLTLCNLLLNMDRFMYLIYHAVCITRWGDMAIRNLIYYDEGCIWDPILRKRSYQS